MAGEIDYIGILRRIMNKDVSETFNQATDSLEAIADALGIGPSVGLSMFGICSPTMVGSTTTIVTTNLIGLPDDIFNGEFYMQVILNANAPGTAPEGEIRRITDFVGATQTFTVDAFSANVEANDLVLILHETLLSNEIVGRGTFTLSDVVNPEDITRTEGNDYFNGCLLMPIEGAARLQPRLIVSYAGAGGVFSLDPGNPFSVAPGLVDYIIVRFGSQFVPLADGTDSRIPADVVGNKSDTAAYALSTTSSITRYLKALHQTKIEATGSADAGSDFNTLVDAARLEANNYWDGLTLLMITGNNAGISRPIIQYMLGVGIEVNPPFPNAIAANDVYVILSDYHKVGQLLVMDFWSDPQEEVSVAQAAGTLALPNVTIGDLPTGAIVARAIAMFKFRMVENTNVLANKLDGSTVTATSQVIQVRDDTPGTWRDAINFVDDQFGLAASIREGGDACIGSIDIAVEVDGNDTYNFQWLLAKADQDSLNFNDVQVGLRIWYSV